MKLRQAVLLGVAVLAAGFAVATPASAATTFTGTVINQANGNCATVPGGASTSALQLTQSACNSSASQNFTFTPLAGSNDTYSVGTLTSGSCLDILGASMGTRDELVELLSLCAERGIRPVVDSTYPLRDARAAFERLSSGAVFGKVVLDHSA